ncbi:PREDICTED: uncharacterized protein LOC105561759 isoform X2 [Vollenhovia emeryi]|uniref:uncharacterized protein LOC105561759 isoform X2 n=1 Tax=Vollenhovia emeryi TaxID=411798 RepID=UPI0005F43D72|nr:PREDICTED: uncharacterized protein LOC105561759 isoform X2 [Vollenhovia emeryi]XP_011867429.1 PREDICTED: uncharacterized protein LOC105561759 isoform X2 [Vollenhovia emeryi]
MLRLHANSTPGFWGDLLAHCPLLSHFFQNCYTTTTTTTTMAPAVQGGDQRPSSSSQTFFAPVPVVSSKRRKRWVITNDYNNLSNMTKQNATRNDKQI